MLVISMELDVLVVTNQKQAPAFKRFVVECEEEKLLI